METESDLALDFASFLLRYHRDLDYSDFSDSLEITDRIKRAESFRSWTDIEDLAGSYESLSTAFEQHKQTAASAFNELYQHMEKFKKDLSFKQADTQG